MKYAPRSMSFSPLISEALDYPEAIPSRLNVCMCSTAPGFGYQSGSGESYSTPLGVIGFWLPEIEVRVGLLLLCSLTSSLGYGLSLSLSFGARMAPCVGSANASERVRVIFSAVDACKPWSSSSQRPTRNVSRTLSGSSWLSGADGFGDSVDAQRFMLRDWRGKHGQRGGRTVDGGRIQEQGPRLMI